MPTVIKALGKADRRTLHDMAKALFLDGECYAFAIALCELTGWPIFALNHGHPQRHVLVRSPNGMYWDVRGEITNEEEIGEPFGAFPPYVLTPTTADELRAVRRVNGVARAKLIIEALWPELAAERGRQARLLEFTRKLEKLSRECNVWLWSPPASHTFLVDGEEGLNDGYTLKPIDTGIAYTINRRP